MCSYVIPPACCKICTDCSRCATTFQDSVGSWYPCCVGNQTRYSAGSLLLDWSSSTQGWGWQFRSLCSWGSLGCVSGRIGAMGVWWGGCTGIHPLGRSLTGRCNRRNVELLSCTCHPLRLHCYRSAMLTGRRSGRGADGAASVPGKGSPAGCDVDAWRGSWSVSCVSGCCDNRYPYQNLPMSLQNPAVQEVKHAF